MRLLALLLLALPAAAQNTEFVGEAVSRQKLMAMKRSQLETLYKSLKPGPIPDGVSKGSGSLAPGEVPGALTEVIIKLFWRGKKFDRAAGKLTNITLFGEMCEAKVAYGPSWMDHKPSIIIDYTESRCPGIVKAIRDEIRMAAPGLYFGYAYTKPSDIEPPVINAIFSLEFAR